MRLGNKTLDLRRPLVVGIVNVTPDSFYDGGHHPGLDGALRHALALIDEGADLIDVGGESTRPGAAEVSADEETARVLPVIESLRARSPVPIAIDTWKVEVARRALEAGATMLNDVTGSPDGAMCRLAAEANRQTGVGLVLMHMPARPGLMGWSTPAPTMPDGVDAGLARVVEDLRQARDRALAAGVPMAQIALDPGLGFGKSHPQNLALLRDLGPVASLGCPVYVGPSRKSFIGRVTGAPPEDRLHGTSAAVAAAVLAGASFVRVHDVAAMREVARVAAAIREAGTRA